MTQRNIDQIRITHIGGPTALIEIGSLRILTDPAFDPAETEYVSGPVKLVKKADPALPLHEIGVVDAVLLSHDQHSDNLDLSGRAYLPQAGRVLTTPAGAQRLGGNAQGVATWETVTLAGSDGLRVQITATPARHGPAEMEEMSGEVNGWLLEWSGQRRGALYISGDTVLFEKLQELPRRYQIGTALLHLGAARVEGRGPAHLTFTAAEAVQLSKMLGEPTVIPIHYEGWAHFVEGRAEIERTFADAGLTRQLYLLPLGQPTTINV